MLPSHSRANGVITGSPPYTVNGLPDEWVALDTGVRFLSIKFRAITHTLSLILNVVPSASGARLQMFMFRLLPIVCHVLHV